MPNGSVKNKTDFLGMNYSTASNRLKKELHFELIKKLELNICYRCGKLIEIYEDLSIEHKKPWLYIDKKLFWDLNNIAYSHKWCNRTDRKFLNQGGAHKDKLQCHHCNEWIDKLHFLRKQGTKRASKYCKVCIATYNLQVEWFKRSAF